MSKCFDDERKMEASDEMERRGSVVSSSSSVEPRSSRRAGRSPLQNPVYYMVLTQNQNFMANSCDH